MAELPPGLFVLHVVTQGSSCFHPAVLLAQHVTTTATTKRRQGRRAALDILEGCPGCSEGLGLMVALHNFYLHSFNQIPITWLPAEDEIGKYCAEKLPNLIFWSTQ